MYVISYRRARNYRGDSTGFERSRLSGYRYDLHLENFFRPRAGYHFARPVRFVNLFTAHRLASQGEKA